MNFDWTEERKERFPYMYLTWCGICPFCKNQVDENTIKATDLSEKGDGMAECATCGSRILVRFSEHSKQLLDSLEHSKYLIYDEVLFEDYVLKLESEDYFSLSFEGVDDHMDTYMTLLYGKTDIARFCWLPFGGRAFLIEKNSISYQLLMGYPIERGNEKWIEHWEELIIVDFVEPDRLFEFYVEKQDRKRVVQKIKNNLQDYIDVPKHFKHLHEKWQALAEGYFSPAGEKLYGEIEKINEKIKLA